MSLYQPCLTGDQPSFVEIGGLTNHISGVHSKAPLSPVGHPPRLPPATQCCICNKKFTTPGGLLSHQSAKQHYPPRPASSPKFSSSEGLAHQSESREVSASSTVVNGSATTNELDVVEQRVIHRRSECQANFDSLAELETHRSTHGKISCSQCSYLSSSLVEWNNHFKQAHQKTQPNTRQADSAFDAILTSQRSPSPAVIRPASSQSITNKGVPPNSPGKWLVICELCKKPFKGQVGLQAHMAAKHPAGAECVICHFVCPSTAALEEHVDTIHSCAVCQDGILRDAQTLSDHTTVHSHPVLCKRCGTRYQTEEERTLHFAAADNDHPVCVACRLGFEDDNALLAHMNLVHAASPQPSSKPSSLRASAEPGVEAAHAATKGRRTFQCDVCYETCLSQTELDVHVVTVHSCPICHDGIYMDMRALEEHLEQHRSPYACHSCGLAYAEEDQLLEHYKDSPSDVHPYCEKCDFGFEDNDTYAAHVDEVHPRIACHVCEGEFFDSEGLAIHYLSSPKHPKCEKCGIGFRDQFDYTDHGASAHPECHCYLCQWHFDNPDILQNHIKHFFNHPKCQECDVRFADADAYQYHLFIVHRPCFGDQGHSDVSAVEPDREDRLPHDLSSPLLSARAVDPVWGFEGSANLPYASFIPLPPSLSGHSSPTSQRVTAESGGSLGSHSRSSTLSVEQRSPTDGQPWNATLQSLSLDNVEDIKASPEFDHSPLSTLPAVGTPLISSVPTIQSVDSDSPFSPRPEPPSLFSLSQEVGGSTAVTVAEHDDVDSDSSSSFTRSPPLISPVVKLPDPGAASPSSTSSWTMTSDTGSRRSSPQPRSLSSSKGISGTFSKSQTATSDYTVPQLSLLVPSSTQLTGSASNSGCPSSISPESAGISVSASMTPEYLREARAYLSLTHQAQEPSSRPVSRSPGISSPILSSTGLALGERGLRREVRFDDNIMSDSGWDRHSTSSDSSLEPPVVLPRPNLKMNGVSKLPRFSALRRPTRRWMTHGHANYNVSPHAYNNRRTNGTTPSPSTPSYHCRSCHRDHCEEPTTTTCGHLFCYECISTAVMKDARCPVCEAPTLLYCLFRIDTSA